MSLNTSNILTIGSVVKLKNGNLVMVSGFAQESKDDYHDYIGVIYPNGFNMNNKEYIYFNSEDIEAVEYYGYSTDNDKTFKEEFIKLLYEMRNQNG